MYKAAGCAMMHFTPVNTKIETVCRNGVLFFLIERVYIYIYIYNYI